ncbi:helix-turn-helix domain-containing protein [Aeromonas veronii]|uniref:helix-turn-helix domain-containing protein n=1 Tax=Aeromonas veronii TaxID=654 RepID=UPI003C7010E8
MRRTSPALEAQVAAALAAGWPIVAIAEQTGISLSTVKRIRGAFRCSPRLDAGGVDRGGPRRIAGLIIF